MRQHNTERPNTAAAISRPWNKPPRLSFITDTKARSSSRTCRFPVHNFASSFSVAIPMPFPAPLVLTLTPSARIRRVACHQSPSEVLSRGMWESIPHSPAGFKREMRFLRVLRVLEIARGGSPRGLAPPVAAHGVAQGLTRDARRET